MPRQILKSEDEFYEWLPFRGATDGSSDLATISLEAQLMHAPAEGVPPVEMDAVHLLGRSFAHALVKTVKLWERPTPYELQKQLEVVADKLPDIYKAGTTLNIWLERETAQAS